MQSLNTPLLRHHWATAQWVDNNHNPAAITKKKKLSTTSQPAHNSSTSFSQPIQLRFQQSTPWHRSNSPQSSQSTPQEDCHRSPTVQQANGRMGRGMAILLDLDGTQGIWPMGNSLTSTGLRRLMMRNRPQLETQSGTPRQ